MSIATERPTPAKLVEMFHAHLREPLDYQTQELLRELDDADDAAIEQWALVVKHHRLARQWMAMAKLPGNPQTRASCEAVAMTTFTGFMFEHGWSADEYVASRIVELRGKARQLPQDGQQDRTV